MIECEILIIFLILENDNLIPVIPDWLFLLTMNQTKEPPVVDPQRSKQHGRCDVQFIRAGLQARLLHRGGGGGTPIYKLYRYVPL